MSKSKLRWPIIVGTLFVVYTVISFALPLTMNGVFWLSYLATVLAIFAQLYFAKVAFLDAKSIQSKFYGFPIIRIGAIYLTLQVVAGLVFMVLATVIPVWVPIIIYVVLIAFALIGTISAETMREEIQRQDEKLRVNVSTMRSLQSQANSLVGLCKDDDLQKKVKAFAEELRYSDPVSSEKTETLEMELAALIGDLQNAVIENDMTSVDALLGKLTVALAERNRVCKLGK